MLSINGVVAIGLISTFIYFIGIISFLSDYETGKCEMTYMFEYPQFVRISNEVDIKYKKYGLYAYSEGRLTEKARDMKFDGIPVLFIPGSGGSHKQCRSFASVALRKSLNSRTRFHFDYFTVDLNNELSGLYGALLQDQLEYANASINRILELYNGQRDPPKRIILIGHSMGGVLAKAILSHLPSNSKLVPIVIALSAPLKRPVLSLDYFFEKFYAKMNRRPSSTVFISVAGGFNDFLVPPYLTEAGDLHAVATHIPKSWVSTDHLSVVWCKQLVMAINRALFESIDLQTKQIMEDHDKILSVFHHHLIHHDGTKSYDREKYTQPVQLTHTGNWHESMFRQYSVRFPKGTREMLWYMVPLVMQAQHEYLTLVALNMKTVDWVYVCPAVSIRNNQRYCESGYHLTHLTEISPSLRYKRRTLRVNLHDLKMNFTSTTHVAIRVMPTSEPVAFHIDVTNPINRKVIHDQGPSLYKFFPQELISQTEEKAIHYEIVLPQFSQLLHYYTLYLDGECTGQHHATATLQVPWNHHENHHYYTDALKQPMTFRLYKSKPWNVKEHASIRLTLDPTCRYNIKMSNGYDLGMLARFYTPWLIANLAAVVLMTLKSQMQHIANNERCSFVLTALKEGAKPYYVVTVVKVTSRLCSGLFFVPVSDAQVIFDENLEILLLPLFLYMISVGIIWLICMALSISLVCFESTFHKLGVKFFTRTFAGRAGWTDHIMKAFDKIPGVVAVVLIAMSFTTCGGLAICLATIFYFLKLTQMAQDFIEDLVKEVAKFIAYRLKDKFWGAIKRKWRKRRGDDNEEECAANVEILPVLDAEDEEQVVAEPSDIKSKDKDNVTPARSSIGAGDECNAEEDDFERPMEFEVQQGGDPTTVHKVDGAKLVEMLNSQISSPETTSTQEDSEESSFMDGFNRSYQLIKEAIENNQIFFHFTIFLIYLMVAVLNLPSVLTWARNYKYSKSLEPDPVFIPALILSACAGPLWQFEFPRVDRRFYDEVSKGLYVTTLLILTYALVSIYRITFILSGVVALVTLHQLLAPKKPEDEEEHIAEVSDSPDDNNAENDSYSERVKAKWE